MGSRSDTAVCWARSSARGLLSTQDRWEGGGQFGVGTVLPGEEFIEGMEGEDVVWISWKKLNDEEGTKVAMRRIKDAHI